MLGDTSRLELITAERARDICRRLSAVGFAERPPLPPETPDSLGLPEDLRLPLIAPALLRDGRPASVLSLLLQYRQTVSRSLVEKALGARETGWLLEAGLIATEGGDLRSRFTLQGLDRVFVWCDTPSSGRDAVMPPGATTVELIRLMPHDLSGSVLDMGGGPASMALVAGRRGGRPVVSSDIGERASVLARFNARFNDLPIDVRTGDLLAPVAGERFDWIVSQPPYVTHPADMEGVTYLHGGAMGDELAFRLLAGLREHLRPGGVAFVLFDSPVRKEGTLHERVRASVGSTSVDVLVLSEPGITADRQAAGYASLADPTYGEGFAAAARRYRDHLDRVGITDVTHSLVVVRAAADEMHEGWTMSLGVARFPSSWEDLATFMRGIDLAATGEEAIAGSRVRPRDGASIVIERRPGADRESEARSVHFSRPGIALDRELTSAGGVIFDLLAAEASIESAIDRFARAMQRPVADVRPIVTAFVRDCLMRGLLVPE